jgi:hypothetical protein
MIDTREIFDDIGESRAVQEYAQEYAEVQVQQATQAATLKSAVAFIRAGIPLEQVATILGISASDITAAASVESES